MAFMPGIWRYLAPFGIKRRGPERVRAEKPGEDAPDPGTPDRRDTLETPAEEARLAERKRVRAARRPREAD